VTQLSNLEESHREQLEALKTEHTNRLNEMEQSQMKTLANMERDLLESHQAKLSEIELEHEAEITNLRSEMNATVEEKPKAVEDSELKDNLIAVLEAENTKLVHEVSDLSSQLLQEQTNNFDLQAKIQDAERNLGSNNADEIAALQEEISFLREKISSTELENSDLCDALENERTESSSLLQSLEETKKELKESQASVASLDKKADSLAEELEREKKRNEALTSDLDALHESYSKISEMEKNRNNHVKEMQVEKNSLLSQVSDLQDQLEASRLSHEAMNASVVELEKVNKELRNSLEDRECLIENLRREHDKTSRQRDELVEQLESAKSSESLISRTLKDQEGELAEIQVMLKTKDDTISDLEQEVQSFHKQVLQEQSTIENLLNSLGEEENTNSVLHASHIDKDQMIESLQDQVNQNKETIRALKASLEKEENENENLAVTSEEHQDEVLRLQSNNEALLDRIETMERQLDDDQEATRMLQTTLQQKETLVENKDAEILSLEKKCVILHIQTKTFQNRIEQVEAENEKLKDSLANQKSTIVQFQGMQQTSETTFAELQRDKLALLERIGSLKEDLETAEATNRKLKLSLSDYQSSYNELKSKHLIDCDKTSQLENALKLLQDKMHQQEQEVRQQTSFMTILQASLEGSHRSANGLEEENCVLSRQLKIQSQQLEKEKASSQHLRSFIGRTGSDSGIPEEAGR
jgi:chromosome segregation ATPase